MSIVTKFTSSISNMHVGYHFDKKEQKQPLLQAPKQPLLKAPKRPFLKELKQPHIRAKLALFWELKLMSF